MAAVVQHVEGIVVEVAVADLTGNVVIFLELLLVLLVELLLHPAGHLNIFLLATT